MHGNATELPHFSSLQNHRGSRIRQFGVGPVKHEHGETPWRTAQIVHSRHGFLTAVTPLVEVRGVQPDLVGDGARIGVEADARDAGSDPRGLPGEHTHRFGVDVVAELHCLRIGTLTHRDDEFRSSGDLRGQPGNHVTLIGCHVCPGPHHGKICVSAHLHAHHESHRVEPGDEIVTTARFGPGPEGGAVIDCVHDVLDVPLGIENQRSRRLGRLQVLQMLGGE